MLSVESIRRTFRFFAHALAFIVLVTIFPALSSASEVSGYFYKRPSFVNLGVGQNSACAVSDVGEVWCWGANSKFQVASRKSSFESTPFKLNGISTALQVVVGREHACALLRSKRVVCWGSNEFGQLGTGFESSFLLESAFAEYVNGVINVSTIFAGDDHSCAITEEKELFCWGLNSLGQVGQLYKDESRQINGRQVIAQAERIAIEEVVDVGLGTSHSCAVTKAGYVFCWGSNLYGQLGQGWSIVKSYRPMIVGSLVDQQRIDSSNNSTCALSTLKSLRCWGAGESGQLGSLDTADLSLPLSSNSTLAKYSVEEFSVGEKSTCAKLDKSSIYCWGSNSFGQVGTSNVSTLTLTPFSTVQIPLSGPNQIESGGDFSCVLESNDVWCWGKNTLGQLGRMTSSTFANYAIINNARWDLGPNSITYSVSQDIVTINWPQIGSSQRYARIESRSGKLLCQTNSALTCDYRAEQIGDQTNALILQVLDINGANHSTRAEFVIRVTSLISAAESKIKEDEESRIKASLEKLRQDKETEELAKLNALLLIAEAKLKIAESRMEKSEDLLAESTDAYNAERDKSDLMSDNLFGVVTEYSGVIKMMLGLLEKLQTLKASN